MFLLVYFEFFDCVTEFITNKFQFCFHYRTLPIHTFSVKTAKKTLQKSFRENVFEYLPEKPNKTYKLYIWLKHDEMSLLYPSLYHYIFHYMDLDTILHSMHSLQGDQLFKLLWPADFYSMTYGMLPGLA